MKNIKFILKLILLLAPIWITMIYTAVYPFGYMDIEYPAWKYTKEVTKDAVKAYVDSASASSDGPTAVFIAGKSSPEGDSLDSKAAFASSQTLILGDSRAMADFVPALFDSNVVNLAVGGATSIEMYYTLNDYIKNNGVPSEVVIMFAPFHYSIIDNFWQRTVYFNYLSVNDLKEVYSLANASESETLLTKGYQNDLLSYRLRFPDKYLPALINSKLIGRKNENSTTYIEIERNLGYGAFGTADGCSDLNYETGYEKMHTTGDALLIDIYMNKLLELCSNQGIKTQVLIPPMNESSVNALNPSYLQSINSYFEDLILKYPSIDINPEIPCYEDMYFGDASHLNNKGAIKFTTEYIQNK